MSGSGDYDASSFSLGPRAQAPTGFSPFFFRGIGANVKAVSKKDHSRLIVTYYEMVLTLQAPLEWLKRTLFPPGVKRTRFENVGV